MDVEKVNPYLLTILYPLYLVSNCEMAFHFLELFIAPDLLVGHDAFEDVFDFGTLAVSTFHILITKPGTT